MHVDAGTYYLVVDGYAEQANGPFTLEVVQEPEVQVAAEPSGSTSGATGSAGESTLTVAAGTGDRDAGPAPDAPAHDAHRPARR